MISAIVMQCGRRSMHEGSLVQVKLETDVGFWFESDWLDEIEEGKRNILFMQRIEGLLNYVADGRIDREQYMGRE